MAHFQNEIIKSEGWSVETNEGTSFVPDSVVSVPAWIKRGIVIDDTDMCYAALRDALADYVSGGIITGIAALDERYFARLSAPGYLDCTDWCAFRTKKEALEYLRD